ncbi:breast cancer type 2 susceptibility protein homolog isoform X1 [Anastrepha ludens]|uniref:breast cancer type 2 susceptibility protein homolog isoform X1 n=1 Tax=Anastrepha ludens TaxID=28586 RepID=UPI0023AEC673|nr:breast cancer type 2 susceptibility protein homolog isoform X1 [Anastrepha ludens]
MADESINSSPQKLNRSIHRSRLHRKNKRLNATFTTATKPPCSEVTSFPANNDRTSEEELSCTLLVMYDSEKNEEDETNAVQLHSVVERPRFEADVDFDPFAEQRLLVLADHCGAPPRSSTNFVATQKFELCSNFLLQSPERPSDKSNNLKSIQGEAFEITDSELLQACVETEKNTVTNNIKQEKLDLNEVPATPESKQKTKTIVDLILEDFCSSPDLQHSSEESSFLFRFANKPLRTYSRLRHKHTIARQNIAEQYGQPTNSGNHCVVDDDLFSNDSSTDLSVQEDPTQLRSTTNGEEVVDLHHSQNLCENLQNLSAYFTELSGSDKKQEMVLESTTQQLMLNKSTNRMLTSAEGSSGIYYTAIKEEANSLLKEVELHTQEQCLTSRSGNISFDEEFKGFPSEDENTCVGIETIPNEDCDIAKTHVDDLESFDDDDEWNDECDFFANFDMEVALDAASASKLEKKETFEVINKKNSSSHHSLEENVEVVPGFRTASNKAVIISAEAQLCASKILQELPPLPTNSGYTDDLVTKDGNTADFQTALNRTVSIPKPEGFNEYSSNTPTSSYDRLRNSRIENNTLQSFAGFETASSKKIIISKEALQQAAKIVEQLPPLPHDHICIMKDPCSTTAPTDKETFVGFRTASSKTIKVSKEAQERASKILEELPELYAEQKLGATKCGTETTLPSANSYIGFRTASSKAIQISEAAQKRAAIIVQGVIDENVEYNRKECLESMQFSEWPVEEVEQIDIKAKQIAIEGVGNVNAPGFATSSKKLILVSDSTKQKTAAILENLPKQPAKVQSKSICKSAERDSEPEHLNNVVFSEWFLAEAIEVSGGEQETQSNGSNKRKHLGLDFDHNDEEPKTPRRTPKSVCKSVNTQRSPLTHIQPTLKRSSLSELAVKTPPDYRASHGIIARKNLLSLNKRNKLSARSLQLSKELREDSSVAETPTKRITNSHIAPITAEPKSPPDTPNLREFFASASMSTSTPHPPARQQTHIRTRARKKDDVEAVATATPTNDSSLKRIEWENESLDRSVSSPNTTSRLSNLSFSNITKMASNPTPKQRIERLRMYGKPPSVSPIYMSSTNNCRISGLKRRTRSDTKNEKK